MNTSIFLFLPVLSSSFHLLKPINYQNVQHFTVIILPPFTTTMQLKSSNVDDQHLNRNWATDWQVVMCLSVKVPELVSAVELASWQLFDWIINMSKEITMEMKEASLGWTKQFKSMKEGVKTPGEDKSKRRSELVRSMTSKDLENHGRYLKWMMAESSLDEDKHLHNEEEYQEPPGEDLSSQETASWM